MSWSRVESQQVSQKPNQEHRQSVRSLPPKRFSLSSFLLFIYAFLPLLAPAYVETLLILPSSLPPSLPPFFPFSKQKQAKAQKMADDTKAKAEKLKGEAKVRLVVRLSLLQLSFLPLLPALHSSLPPFFHPPLSTNLLPPCLPSIHPIGGL